MLIPRPSFCLNCLQHLPENFCTLKLHLLVVELKRQVDRMGHPSLFFAWWIERFLLQLIRKTKYCVTNYPEITIVRRYLLDSLNRKTTHRKFAAPGLCPNTDMLLLDEQQMAIVTEGLRLKGISQNQMKDLSV